MRERIKILDACCGSRMFWFDKQNPDGLFVDKRHETLVTDSRQGRRAIIIKPDIVADFTALPFKDNCFSLVIYDPPHLTRHGKKSWMSKKYGKLEKGWEDMLRQGFAESFRVLKTEGVLIFKWNETDVKVSIVLSLTPVRPLVGNRCGKTAKTHWMVFMKK